MSAYISDFQLIRPDQDHEQAALNSWLSAAWRKDSPSLNFDRYLVSPEKIHRRGSFHPDFGKSDLEKLSLFGGDFNPNFRRRNDFFQKTATDLFSRFYQDSSYIPDEMIHVSCTGYCSPSAAQLTVGEKEWNAKTSVTHLYHMGCYAALPALKIAKAFASEKRVTDIVHTELCSLHFDVKNHSAEQSVVQSLFSDGAIRYKIQPKEVENSIEILNVREEIIPASEKMMTWTLGENNLSMSLDRAVPVKIKKHLKKFVEAQFNSAGLDFHVEREKCQFALHPGGPKIIEQISQLLELNAGQVSHSNGILQKYGNMSSATLPHIWDAILKDKDIPRGSLIYSAAFGPGLTMAGMLGRKK